MKTCRVLRLGLRRARHAIVRPGLRRLQLGAPARPARRRRRRFTDFAARPRRLDRFLSTYGWPATTAEFFEVVQARAKAHAYGIRDLAAAGDEVSARLLRQGVADDLDQAIAELTSLPR